ncbi:putative reverse transcriptase domain-containing protein [Tanacetum coccineum]
MGIEITTSDVREDDEEFEAEASAADTRVRIDRITKIETTQRQLETSQMVASGEQASLETSQMEEFCQVRRDRDDTRRRLRSQNGSDNDNGNGGNGDGENGNGENGKGGNGNPNENGRGNRPVARECTYQDFMKCQPLNFKGTALTWWNSHKRTIGTEAAFSMSWRELMKLMTEVYCLRNEIQKMETELWNLTVKNNDLAAYT